MAPADNGSGCLISTGTAVYTFAASVLNATIAIGLADLAPGADTSVKGQCGYYPRRRTWCTPLGRSAYCQRLGLLPDTRIVVNGTPIATSFKSADSLRL